MVGCGRGGGTSRIKSHCWFISCWQSTARRSVNPFQAKKRLTADAIHSVQKKPQKWRGRGRMGAAGGGARG